MAEEKLPKREQKAEGKEPIDPGTHRWLPRPGYYILSFIDRRDIPSVSRFIQLG